MSTTIYVLDKMKKISRYSCLKLCNGQAGLRPSLYGYTCNLGPVVQSLVSLMSSLRVISLTVLADSIHNILIFFAEKM